MVFFWCVVYVYVSPSFLQKNLLLLSEGRRCNNADETSRQASLCYMFSSKFMLKIGEESGGVKLSPNCCQHLATSVSFVHRASE